MKTLAVFGASGRTGKEVVVIAEKEGIVIKPVDKRNLEFDELCQAVRHADFVLIVFGPRPPYTDIFCARTTRQIIQAMKAENVKRLICQTGAMIGDYKTNRSFIFELFSNRFKKSNSQGYEDRVKQEEAVKNSFLDWTIVKPPRLTLNKKDLSVKAGEKIKVGLLSSLSRKSLGRFIVDEFLNPKHIGRVIFIKN